MFKKKIVLTLLTILICFTHVVNHSISFIHIGTTEIRKEDYSAAIMQSRSALELNSFVENTEKVFLKNVLYSTKFLSNLKKGHAIYSIPNRFKANVPSPIEASVVALITNENKY